MIRVLPIIFGSFIVTHHAATIEKKRVPKFEFYVYNDNGYLVKQYLTSEQIQELLRGRGQPAGEEQIKYLLGRESEEIPMPTVNNFDNEASEAQIPLAVPRVSHEDSPDLRRVMTKVWTLVRKAESDRTSTTTMSTTTSTTTTTTTTTRPVVLVEMDEKLAKRNISNLMEEKDLLCLKFAKKCIKLGKLDSP